MTNGIVTVYYNMYNGILILSMSIQYEYVYLVPWRIYGGYGGHIPPGAQTMYTIQHVYNSIYIIYVYTECLLKIVYPPLEKILGTLLI